MLIFCPSCQRQLRIPDEAVGKQVKCPSCEKVFTPSSVTTGEEIQAPPAPLPTSPSADTFAEERHVRRDYDIGRDDVDWRDDRQAHRLAGGAAVWFFVAALATLLISATNIIMSVALDEIEDILLDFGPGDEEAIVGVMICGFGCCGTLVLGIAVTMIVAGLQLKSFGNKGWIITGIVEALGVTLFFGGGVLLNAFHMLVDTADALDHWVPVKMLLGGLAAVLNCVAGIKAILALNNPAVSAELDRRRSRRRIRWED
jgi:predicted Zn finger-like uncharacterized protein